MIFSKNRWVTRSALLWSELIGVPTASIDAEQSYRRGLISVVASLLAAGCPLAIWGQTLAMNRAFELYERLREEYGFEVMLDWGETYLGAVTGNNDYFTLTRPQAYKLKLQQAELLRKIRLDG